MNFNSKKFHSPWKVEMDLDKGFILRAKEDVDVNIKMDDENG